MRSVDPNTTISPFAGVGSIRIFSPTDGAFICSGVPIQRWFVLTTGYCFDLNDDGIIDVTPTNVTFRLNFGGNQTHIIAGQNLYLHPDYTGFANPVVNDSVAILHLSAPLPKEVPIYPLHTTPLVGGEEVTMVGYGRSGTGVDGYTTNTSFSIKRVGGNVIDQLDPDDEGGAALEVYRYDFDGPPGNNHIGGDIYRRAARW